MLVSLPYNIILASKSPRRKQLLQGLGLNFTVKTKDVEEVYPAHLKREEVALYLSELKAQAFKKDLENDTLIITADTIVCVDDLIIGKPKDYNEAQKILNILSGNKHDVITAVSLLKTDRLKSFYVTTAVYFKSLTEDEIKYYISEYQPYDKAGAYGIQEWIGYIGIEKIEGSYFNVMGLPTKELYEELLRF